MIIIQKHLDVYGNITKMCQMINRLNLTDSQSFKCKIKITGNTPADGNTKNVEIIVPLK